MAGRPQVLIVEDDVDIGSALRDRLVREAFDVTLVKSAADAIEWLDAADPPCVVLVDLLMPGIVGHSLLRHLRTDVRFASIPVAVVSGAPQLAPEGYRVFRKPLDLQPLIEFVRDGCAANGVRDAAPSRA
ncbi:MAG TPA: response regulator [Kofleriaceae bacterium]|jgi:CheY-like chemotaxis protein|nr:response regulator [Kofleriaceae bacterium]